MKKLLIMGRLRHESVRSIDSMFSDFINITIVSIKHKIIEIFLSIKGKEMIDHLEFMNLALDQARLALEQGEFPVGCVIVQDEKVLATAARTGTANTKNFFNELNHAEIQALKQFEERKKTFFDPYRTVLYSTMEPCLMCYGAIILAGIRKIVFAYEDVMGGAICCDLKKLSPIYRDCQIEVVPGVAREKSLDLFYNFFNKETNLYWKNSLLANYTLKQGAIQGRLA